MGLDAQAGLGVGALPRVAPAIGGAVSLLGSRWGVRVGGEHWFAATARLSGDDASARVRLSTGHAVACGRLGGTNVELAPCAGVELGSLFGAGDGLDEPQDDRLFWAAARADVRGVWTPIDPLAIFAQLGVSVPLRPYRFHVNGDARIHEAAPVTFRAGLGGQFRLF